MTDRSQHAGAGSGRGRPGPPGRPPHGSGAEPPPHPPGFPPAADSCSPEQRVALGSYALGALDPGEADRVRTHLMECAACRTEYRELAGVPALLARISEAEMSAEPAEPSAGMLAGLLARAAAREAAGFGAAQGFSGAPSQGTANVPAQAQGPAPSPAAEPAYSPGHALGHPLGHAAGHGAHDPTGPGQRARGRRRAAVRQKSRLVANLWSGGPARRLAVSAGGAVLLTATAAGVYVAAFGSNGAALDKTVQATNAAMGITGSVHYHPTEWGSWVEVTMRNVPPGDDCMLLAVDGKGNRVVASTWWAPSSGVATIPGAVAMQAGDITKFEVVTATGSTLLDVPAH